MIRLARPAAVIAALAGTLAILIGSGSAGAQPADALRTEMEAVIRTYLLRNPEVVQEALNQIEAKKQSAQRERGKSAFAENAALIRNSPRQVTLGNPNGDVTLVEFFDYNCGYCKRAMNDLVELLQSEPNVKVVLKELPVLGANSTEAAKVAVALHLQDPAGARYLDFHKKLLGGPGPIDRARALAVAKEAGADMERLEKDLAGHPEVDATLAETRKLADALGIRGTPSYVVGDEVVVGATGAANLKAKVQQIRATAVTAAAKK